MTKNTTVIIAAILTTLLETDGGPESSLYCGLGMDIHLWERIKFVLLRENLIEINSYWCELTDAGRELAHKCNEALAAR